DARVGERCVLQIEMGQRFSVLQLGEVGIVKTRAGQIERIQKLQFCEPVEVETAQVNARRQLDSSDLDRSVRQFSGVAHFAASAWQLVRPARPTTWWVCAPRDDGKSPSLFEEPGGRRPLRIALIVRGPIGADLVVFLVRSRSVLLRRVLLPGGAVVGRPFL